MSTAQATPSTPVEPPPTRTPPLSRAASDAIELATLQGRLFLADGRACMASVRTGVALGAVGLALLVAAAPLALVALAMWLQGMYELSPEAAYAIVAASAAVIGACFGYAAIRSSRDGFALLSRSCADLEENLKALTHPDDTATTPSR
ncbi:phage holin family protein [Botrimarina sp.]|uniref:phage holin family protein n=1 Tax=Botrimarina sp. TaxID=2795802 RepID=UPI0032EB3BB5